VVSENLAVKINICRRVCTLDFKVIFFCFGKVKLLKALYIITGATEVVVIAI